MILVERSKNRTAHEKDWHRPDGSPAYREVASELHYRNGEDWLESEFSFEQASATDRADFKTSRSPDKVGFARKGWTVGRKINGFQLLMSLRKTALWNTKTGEHLDIENADHVLLNGNGYCGGVFKNASVRYSKKQGSFSQRISINSANGLPASPYGADCEFSYWTEIKDDPDLRFYISNPNPSAVSEYKDHAGYWDKETDTGAETVWLQAHGKDLIMFQNVALREPEHATPEKDEVPGIYEKKRLVKRDGKIYLVESVPLDYVKGWDYSKGNLNLNYTTVSGALGSHTTWTSGTTYYITGTITLGAFNLTVENDVVIKQVDGITQGIQSTGTGLLSMDGTAALPIYWTSVNDDSVGDIIAGSTGICTRGDYDISYHQSSTTGGSMLDYVNIRYSDSGGQSAIYCSNSNHGSITVNDCSIVYCNYGFYQVVASVNTMTFTDCYVNCLTYGFIANKLIATNIQIYSGSVALQLSGDSTLKNILMESGDFSYGLYVPASATVNMYNYLVIGSKQTSSQDFGIRSNNAGAVVNAYYGIIINKYYGIAQTLGTITHDYNCVCANTLGGNFITTTVQANEFEYDPVFEAGIATRQARYMLNANSPCFVTTTDKVNDAGFEYALGKTALADNTVLVAGDNIPFGYLYEATTTTGPAVDIDVVLKLAGTRTVTFDTNDTVQVTGSLESNVDITTPTITIKVKKLSDDSLIATLVNTTSSLTAATPKTFATINGSAVEWTATPADDYYIDVEVSGGTPAIDVTTDTEVAFTVQTPADVTPPGKASNEAVTNPASDGDLTLSWDKSVDDGGGDNDVDRYGIAVSSVSAAAVAVLANAGTFADYEQADGSASYSKTIGGLTNLTVYYIIISPIDSSGNYNTNYVGGDAVTATPSATVGDVILPFDITATQVGSFNITLDAKL